MKPPKDFADCVPGPREVQGPPIHHSLEINDLQRRVDQYFQSGQRREPAGRLILDLLRALRKAHAVVRRVQELNAENLADLDAMMDPTREPGSIP